MLTGLDQHNNATVRELTPQLISIFAQVLGPPEEQLDAETREKVKETVKYLVKENPGLVQGNEVLMAAMQG